MAAKSYISTPSLSAAASESDLGALPELEEEPDLGNEAAKQELGRGGDPTAPPGSPDGLPADPMGAATSGSPSALPYLEELEQHFQATLSHIRVYLAQPAVAEMGAEAVSSGQTIAFVDANPDLNLVAEEVAHTFQGQGPDPMSSPSGGDEKAAKGAADKIEAGESVDVGGLGQASAKVQRRETTDATATEYAPDPALRQMWWGNVFVYKEDKDYAEAAMGRPIKRETTFKGLETLTKEDFTKRSEEKATARNGVRDQLLTGLDTDKPYRAIATFNKNKAAVESDPKKKVFLPYLYDDPLLWSNAAIIEISRTYPEFVKAQAQALDPVQVLKDRMTATATDGTTMLVELQLWISTYPTHGPRAAADADILGLLARVDVQQVVNKVVDGAAMVAIVATGAAVSPMVAAEVGIATISPVIALAVSPVMAAEVAVAQKLGLTDLAKKKIAHWVSSESGLQVNCLQLLLDAGVVDEEDPGIKMERAIADCDAVAFMDAWVMVLSDEAIFKKYSLDPVFMTDVEKAFDANTAQIVRDAIGAGPVAISEAAELNADQLAQIETLSSAAAKECYEELVRAWFGPSSSDVISALTQWKSSVEAFLMASHPENKLDPTWYNQAKTRLKAMYSGLSGGRSLGADLNKLGDDTHKAASIIGLALVASSDEVSAEYPSKLEGDELGFVEGLIPKTVTDLADELDDWFPNDKKVMGFIDDFKAKIAQKVMPAGEDPRQEWAADQRRRHARTLLEAAYKGTTGLDLQAEILKGLGGERQKDATTFFAEAQQAFPMPTDPDKYSDKMDAAETAAVDGVARVYASKLDVEFDDWFTSSEKVYGILDECHTEMLTTLEPAAADVTSDMRTAWLKKTDEAMQRLKSVFDSMFGSLNQKINDEVWKEDYKRKCLQLVGGHSVPTKALAELAVGGVDNSTNLVEYQKLLGDLQGEIEDLAGDFEKQIGDGDDAFDEGTKKRVTKRLTEVATKFTKVPGKYDCLVQDSTTFTAATFLEMLVVSYKARGGDLAIGIADRINDQARADTVLALLGLPSVAVSSTRADAGLSADVLALDTEAAGLEPGEGEELTDQQKEERAKRAEKIAAMKTQLQAQILSRQELTYHSQKLFNLVEKFDCTKAKEHKATWPPIETELNSLAGVTGAWTKPLKLGTADTLEPIAGTAQLTYVYRQVCGIDIATHLGFKLGSAKSAAANQILTGVKITSTSAPASGDENIAEDPAQVAQLEAELGIDQQDVHAGFDIVEASKRASGLKGRINTVAGFLFGAPLIVGAAISVLTLNPTTLAGAIVGRRTEKVKQKNLLLAYVGQMGGPEETRIIKAMFEKMYGSTVEYAFNCLFEAGGDTAVNLNKYTSGEDLTFADEIRDLAAAKQVDEIYTTIFGATTKEKAELLADGAVLQKVRELGNEVYDRVYRSATGELTLAEMLRSRDGDDGEYGTNTGVGILDTITGGIDMVVTKGVNALGLNTDEDGMKKDIELFANAMKAKINAAKSTRLQVKDDSLWNATESYVGAGARWPELYLLNTELVGQDPDLIHSNVTLRVPPSWISGLVDEDFKKQCRNMMTDAEVKSLLEQHLSGDDLLELKLLNADGGKLTGTHKVLVDVEGLGTSGTIIDDLKAMSDEERKAAAQDPRFLAKLMHDMDGDELQQALSIVHGSKATDGVVDMQTGANGNNYEIGQIGGLDIEFDTVKEDKIFEGFLGLDAEQMRKFANDGLSQAEIFAKLEMDEEGEGQLFKEMMEESQKRLTVAPEPKDPANPTKAEKKATAKHTKNETVQHLIVKHAFTIRRACFGGAKDLLKAAQDVYKEKGELTDPAATDPATAKRLHLFDKSARTEVFNLVKTTVENEYPDYSGAVLKAVKGTEDPTGLRLEKALEWGNDDAEITDAISKAPAKKVIEEWSNILVPGDSGCGCLKEVWEDYALARQAYLYSVTDGVSEDKLFSAKEYMNLMKRDFTQFDLGTQHGILEKLQDENWMGDLDFMSSTESDMLVYKEAIIKRIVALKKEEIATALGMADDHGNTKDMATIVRGDDELSASVSEEDVDMLMNDQRKVRTEQGINNEKAMHQLEGGSLYDAFDSSKSEAIAWSSLRYNQEIYSSEEAKEGEEVGDIDKDELGKIESQLAALNRSIDDYKAAKTAMADAIKMVIAAIAAVVTAVFTGPAGPTLIASLLIAAGTATASALVDEVVQGKDYSFFKEGLPSIVKATGQELLTFGLTKGWNKLCSSWPKTTGAMKDSKAWFEQVTGQIGDAWKKLGPAGDIIKGTIMGGVVNPTLDVLTAPLLHLMDPSALKYGWTSAEKEAAALFETKMADLPEDIKKKTWESFVASLGDVVTDKIMGEPPKGSELVPGVTLDKSPPPIPNLWKAVVNSGKEAVDPRKIKEFFVKELVGMGVLVLTSDKPLDAFDSFEVDALLGKLFQGRVDDFINGIGEDFQKQVGARAAHDKYVDDEKAVKALAITGPDGQAYETDVLASQYKWWLENKATGDDINNMTPEKWAKSVYFQDMERRIGKARETWVKEGGTEDHWTVYKAWLLDDPSKLFERSTQADTFNDNYKSALDFVAKGSDPTILNGLTPDQRTYAQLMLSDPLATFDIIGGKASKMDLTTPGGAEQFVKAYEHSKRSLILQAVDISKWSGTKQAAFKAAVKKLDSKALENIVFGPDAVDTDIAKASVEFIDDFEKAYTS